LVNDSLFLETLISISILLLAAKLLSEAFYRLKLPPIVGQILAGVVFGPFAVGGLVQIDGRPLVATNEIVEQLGQLSAIIILFVAGMKITPKEFFAKGTAEFSVGTLGLIIPFVLGILVFTSYGFGTLESLIIATALSATSIAVSFEAFRELRKDHTEESKLVLGAAIVDDVLTIAILSVVVAMIPGNAGAPLTTADITFTILKVLGVFAALVLASTLLVPRLLNKKSLWKSPGGIEGITTAAFLGSAAVAAVAGLSPIVGSFVVGMAVAGTKVKERIERYANHLDIIFLPLFFVLVGANMDLRGVNAGLLYMLAIIIPLAVASKVAGAGIPSLFFLKDRMAAARTGVAMVTRSEVALIVASAGLSLGILGNDAYTMIVVTVAFTVFVVPVWLKLMYRHKPRNH
jgi:Kef-type K+ transport system membrane component KefB